MRDSTDGAIFNKCNRVTVGLSSTVSLENRLLKTNGKKYQKIRKNKRKDTET